MLKKAFLGSCATAAAFLCLGFSLAAQNTSYDPWSTRRVTAPTDAEFAANPLASSSTEPVGMRMVILFDISGSVDDKEYEIVLKSLADAIGSDSFRRAIFEEGGPQSIALCVAQFDDNCRMSKDLGWVDIRKGDEGKLEELARNIGKMDRRGRGSTGQIAALEYATLAFKKCRWRAVKDVTGLVTDGKENVKTAPAIEIGMDSMIDSMAQQGITVNALITQVPEFKDLEEWARAHLITKAGCPKADGTLLDPGFVEVVATRDQRDKSVAKYNGAMARAVRAMVYIPTVSLTPSLPAYVQFLPPPPIVRPKEDLWAHLVPAQG